jgi:hypothetical protein
MKRLVSVALILMLCIGCAGTLKYQRAKRTQFVPRIEMDSVIVTPEANRGKHLFRLCDYQGE